MAAGHSSIAMEETRGNLGPTLCARPRQPCGGEQCRPTEGTQNPAGLSPAQLSRHSHPLPIGYFCYGMCQPLGFSWGTRAQVTPSLHSAPPSVSGCVWGWAGSVPAGIQGLLAGTDTLHIRTVSVHVPVHVSEHATFASRALGNRTACMSLECTRRNLKLSNKGATNSHNFGGPVEPDNGHDAIVSS